MAECHPVGFQWVTEAKARGARIIHVDPRFTRTAAIADKHVPIRAGSHIVLLVELISRHLSQGKHLHEHVRPYTNAAILISTDCQHSYDHGVLHVGRHQAMNSYRNIPWSYQADQHGAAATVP